MESSEASCDAAGPCERIPFEVRNARDRYGFVATVGYIDPGEKCPCPHRETAVLTALAQERPRLNATLTQAEPSGAEWPATTRVFNYSACAWK